MNQTALDRILRCNTLPSLPAVAVRVIELTASPKTSLNQLASVIQNDQGLAAKVLRTVNSSFYGLRRPCSTINQSLVMLGLSTVKSLALSFSMVASLSSRAHEEFDFVSYWRRGLYTAVAAKSIARAAHIPQEDEAFLGGLLQDVGMVAMHQALGRDYLKVMLEAGPDHHALTRLELAAFELQHPEVGAILAQRWKLPPDLVIPIRYHEHPTAAPSDHAEIVRCIGLGNIAHDLLTDPQPAPALARFHARAAEWFRIDAAAADDLIRKISDGARQLAPLFRVNTGQFADVDAIMTRARDQAGTIAQDQPGTDPLAQLVAVGDQNDPLTGALGFDAMTTRAEAAFAAARDRRTPLAVISIALDGFDRIVAAGGELAGDALLVEAAAFLQSELAPRRGVVGRLEPSAFTILLPDLDHVQAVRIGSDLRAAIESKSQTWSLPGLPPLPITASIGIAAHGPGSPFTRIQQLLSAARRAAEASTAAGGNCLRAFRPRAAA